jgi:hypothetical protein
MNEEDKEEQISEGIDFSKPDFGFKPKEYHEWRQRGPYLVCTSCDLEHAVYIGMDKILVGLDEKGPILKKR